MSDTIQLTEDQLTVAYSAMLDSVELINALIAGEVASEDPAALVAVNIEHLNLMVARHDFGDRDMSAIDTARAIDANTVEITTYVDQSDAYAAQRARTIKPRAFMDRFTEAEKLEIMTMSQQSAQVQLWLSEALADEVWLDHPKVDAGLQAVIDGGATHLTPARKLEIIGV